MNRTMLARRLRLILIGIALCGLMLYVYLLPALVGRLLPDRTLARQLYTVLLCLSAIPCYLALADAWRIVCAIGRDRSFTARNAALLRRISTLAAIDAAYLFLCVLVLHVCGMGDTMLLLLSLMFSFIGIAVAVAAAALSHLVLQAAELQEQSDLTI